MNKLLKFKKEESDKIVFISDMHFTHDREFLWGDRGFKSSEEHDKFLLNNWKENIDEGTVVFNLGDVVFRDPNSEKFDIIAELPCKEHYLLWGNHNSGCKNVYKRAVDEFMGLTSPVSDDIEIYPLRYKNVTFCGNDLSIRVGKKEIHLSHFAKRVWDHIGYGAWALSGHSHSSDHERNADHPRGKCLDVGVENAIKHSGNMFFTYREVESIMNNKSVELVDHHDDSITPSR